MYGDPMDCTVMGFSGPPMLQLAGHSLLRVPTRSGAQVSHFTGELYQLSQKRIQSSDMKGGVSVPGVSLRARGVAEEENPGAGVAGVYRGKAPGVRVDGLLGADRNGLPHGRAQRALLCCLMRRALAFASAPG